MQAFLTKPLPLGLVWLLPTLPYLVSSKSVSLGYDPGELLGLVVRKATAGVASWLAFISYAYGLVRIVFNLSPPVIRDN